MKIETAKRIADAFGFDVSRYQHVNGCYVIRKNETSVIIGIEIEDAKHVYKRCRRYAKQVKHDAERLEHFNRLIDAMDERLLQLEREHNAE